MTNYLRLKTLQDSMNALFNEQQSATSEDLACWISDLDLALADTHLATVAFRKITDVSHSLNLLARVFSQADAEAITSGEIGVLMEVVQGRVDTTLARIQESYL